ncbi:hypothetical protein LTR17_017777 [Elasticomyces elasticus]|nr:hypothetical protein LTR17_017777 [Elasticomyces elasticus]
MEDDVDETGAGKNGTVLDITRTLVVLGKMATSDNAAIIWAHTVIHMAKVVLLKLKWDCVPLDFAAPLLAYIAPYAFDLLKGALFHPNLEKDLATMQRRHGIPFEIAAEFRRVYKIEPPTDNTKLQLQRMDKRERSRGRSR